MAGRERGKSLPKLAGRRVAAGALLGAATLLALGATQRLARLGDLPDSRLPYYAAFAAAVALAFAAGSLLRRAADDESLRELPAPRDLVCRRSLSVALAAAAIVLLFRTWQLDRLSAPPPSIYLWWLSAMTAAVLAFPRVRTSPAIEPLTPALSPKGRGRILPIVLIACALAGAAAARLPDLGRSPAVYGGDEANQAMDGRSLLERTWTLSPFGAGWYSTMRPGMVPAGAGAMAARDPVAGSRLPYAIAGTLSVAATGAAGWLVAGPWAGAAAAALLAFAPHHVHFSRLSSVMILDALFAPLCLFLLLRLARNGSPRVAAVAGATAGLSLYGYAGGRAITLVFLLVAPVAAFRAPVKGRSRWLLLPALVLPFLAVAGPNIHYAFRSFALWNGRLGQVGVLSRQWWETAVQHWGSAGEAASEQFALGTIGLLSAKDLTTWFAAYPILGPSLFIALSLAGIGWLFGRGRLLPATLLLLLAGANVAGVVLTSGAPTPQRASSLLPMLAILGGAAVAGFLSLLPDSAAGVRWRAVAGAAFLSAYLLEMAARRPFAPDASPDYAGAHTAFAQEASKILLTPAGRARPAYVYGIPYLSTDLPTFHYMLGDRRPADRDAATIDAPRLPPGLHFFAPEFEGLGRRVRVEVSARGFPLPHPADPLRNVGYVVRIRDNDLPLLTGREPGDGSSGERGE